MLPIDRTQLALAQANQTPSNVFASSPNKGALLEAFNTIDELYAFTQGLISAGTLSRLGLVNVKDYNASGSDTTTTGSITTGTARLTVASTSTFAAGQGISIAGAGAAGAALVTTISSVSGLVITLADNASTTVSGEVIKHDESVAFQSAIAAIATNISGTSGWRSLNTYLLIPGGRYNITQKRVFDLSTYGISGVRGFNIYGAGFENTQITFDNDSADADNYLIYNDDDFGFSEIKDIRFVSANNTEKCIYHATAGAGNAQSMIFNKVSFDGFQTAIAYEGATKTSEKDYYSCKFINIPVGGRGIYVNNLQSVNHNLYACDFETIAGNGIHVAAGGNINMSGGSVIPIDGGIILYTSDTTGTLTGTGNNVFNFYGVRAEMSGTGKLFDVASNLVLNFNGCNLTREISGTGNIRGTFGDYQTFVTFTNCTNSYKYECRYDNSVYTDGACTAHFENCAMSSELADTLSITGTGGNTAGQPVFSSNRCRKNSTGTTQRTVMDVTLNKERSNLARSIPTHTVLLRVGNDNATGLPANAGTTFVLPLNSIVKKIRIVKLVSANVGSYAYDVEDYLGTTTFVSLGSTAQNVEATATSLDLWYRVDSVAKQTITVNQTGTNNTQAGYIVVEYI